MTCPTCGGPVEPMTLNDELPGGRAETGECRVCDEFTTRGTVEDGEAWAIEDQRRHEAIERRAFAPIWPFGVTW